MPSLQDQLLKAGLADAKKAKQIKKEKRKQARQVPKGQQAVDETKLAAKQSMAEKAERDRELNRQRQAEAEQRAIAAQIKQLIAVNKVSRGEGDVAYQFAHGKKVKKLYVTSLLQEQLSKGLLAIVEYEDSYELVPAKVAEKISQRDAQRVLVKNDASKEVIDEDDPYADYQIPDDLMW